ncbi:MAG TPA: adenine phosphoribosyltransferase [Cytophagaceae bacterium]|jgi:adenine phosphoribosyltransferase|nr:adenine phosphoribosyltransferase [Cytophagaceae bacterium]
MIQASQGLESKMKTLIRDVPDFPKPGILFKDLSPLLKSPEVAAAMIQQMVQTLAPLKPDALVCLESRGFWFGLPVSLALGIPMIPMRKKGKLPYACLEQEYALEYGSAIMEMHIDALEKNWKVIVHDDLLATGGTAEAAAKLVHQASAEVCAFSFLVELEFLQGRKVLETTTSTIQSLVRYT